MLGAGSSQHHAVIMTRRVRLNAAMNALLIDNVQNGVMLSASMNKSSVSCALRRHLKLDFWHASIRSVVVRRLSDHVTLCDAVVPAAATS